MRLGQAQEPLYLPSEAATADAREPSRLSACQWHSSMTAQLCARPSDWTASHLLATVRKHRRPTTTTYFFPANLDDVTILLYDIRVAANTRDSPQHHSQGPDVSSQATTSRRSRVLETAVRCVVIPSPDCVPASQTPQTCRSSAATRRLVTQRMTNSMHPSL